MNKLQLYNSLTGKKEEFVSIVPNHVGLYTCGPTVYNYAHIGNLRTYIFNDLLVRALTYFGYQVKRVMNVTDVGHLTGDGDMGMDKVEKASAEKNMTAWELSEFYLKAFKSDMARLNLLPPTVWEKATDTVPEQISLISQLEEKGLTYKTSDGIYFDTKKFPEYGQMSSLRDSGIIEGARVDVNPERKNPRDFALWKFNISGKKRAMEWDSPWGIGFPGWHIECSAISLKHLGAPFDIHTGAIDHKEIHHPNEIAQTEVATGRKMANYWLHAGFLNAEKEEKMAKSAGNFLTLQTLIDKGYDPLAYKLYTYSSHWRQTIAFSWEALDASSKALEKLYGFVSGNWPNLTNLSNWSNLANFFEKKFANALADDLNMPKVMAVVWELVNESKKNGYQSQAVQKLLEWDKVLGLNLDQDDFVKEIPQEAKKLIAQRDRARASKNYALADSLRKQLEALGVKVQDK
ncbi:cysteine--tRNA ligase [Candidatus Parcubacteria bacterium]|nr:cysteine--tRNA ligase [Patescibacteria group bacterium]MCG2689026.1 cysteine--tRNA ligase [Candidatus Parcubacteria bacterium]